MFLIVTFILLLLQFSILCACATIVTSVAIQSPNEIQYDWHVYHQ